MEQREMRPRKERGKKDRERRKNSEEGSCGGKLER